MKLLKPVIATLISLAILAYFLPTVSFMHWTTIIIAALVLTVLNKLIKPVLKLLFLPINIATLGIFSVLLNIFLLWLATYLVPGFQIESMNIMGVNFNYFFSLLLIAFLLGLVQNILGFVL